MKMDRVLCVAMSLVCAFARAGEAAVEQPLPGDVRILVDVSGSMKQSDPANGRASALRLIAHILPDGSQAGIWTFARYANMLVPLREINTSWAETVRDKASDIKAWGPYKDIANVLSRATWDWKSADKRTDRHLVIVTDGWVSVSAKAQENQLSRRKILEIILPRLLQAGVHIHSIALGEDIDESLLRELAIVSGGTYQTVSKAGKPLTKALLTVLDQTGLVNELPLINQRVVIDKQADSALFIFFHDRPELHDFELIAPDGRHFSRNSRHGEKIGWLQNSGYDLVRIQAPASGEWRLAGTMHPDNRIYVRSKLRLITSRPVGTMAFGAAYRLGASLVNNKSVVRNREFLELVTAGVVQDNADGGQWTLRDDGQEPDAVKGDGVFTIRLLKSLVPGLHNIVAYVDGIKFRRQIRQTVNVVEQPLTLVLVPEHKAYGTGDYFSLISNPAMIRSRSVKIKPVPGHEQSPDRTLVVDRANPWEWRLQITENLKQSGFPFVLNVTGLDNGGKKLRFQIKPGLLSYKNFDVSSTGHSKVANVSDPPAAAVPARIDHSIRQSVSRKRTALQDHAAVPAKPADTKLSEWLAGWWQGDQSLIYVMLLLGLCGGFLTFSIMSRRRKRLMLQQIFEKVWSRESDRRAELMASLRPVFDDDETLVARINEIIQAENLFHQRLLDALTRRKMTTLVMLDRWTDEVLSVYRNLLVDNDSGSDIKKHLQDKFDTMAQAIAAFQQEKERIARQLKHANDTSAKDIARLLDEKTMSGRGIDAEARAEAVSVGKEAHSSYSKISTLSPRTKQ